jgi:1-deoxy-D-xylulose 5-phosphate reductoisomerase
MVSDARQMTVVTVLGATGSVGKSALDLVRRDVSVAE